MTSPPQIKKPTTRRKPHGELVEPEVATQLTANINQSWSIPPNDRDGFNVHIGTKGHIVLSQSRPFEHEAEIILHPVEARALRKILPLAIASANQHRNGVPI